MTAPARKVGSVSICVCTCKRPQGLARLLQSLRALQMPPAVEVELVVVDNDVDETGREVAEAAIASLPFPARYCVEATPGLSFARNRCFSEAANDWVAFVDDDEWVEPDWLLRLIGAAVSDVCDVVIAPVESVFEVAPPSWIAASGAFSRPAFASGMQVDWRHCASGNALIKRDLHARVGGFDVEFGASGGEDTDFFIRCAAAGARAIWCEEALVHEGVPAHRLTREWLLKRCVMNGRNYARIVGRHLGWRDATETWLRGAIGVTVFGFLAVFARLCGRSESIRYERLAAMGYGKMTPWRISRRGLYGDARVN